ncbi:MAG: hypothetical protein NC097_03530 [Clostridium sp.]|nr:hypothetical protein [Prevotella sp.]MCM1428849.1 hypothetical protein [Clostridium sp.]MCM1475224.1 hypothetical protein [Muribaculaceae bacterium]
MQDLNKVNESQLYNLWKNLSISLFTLVAVLALSMVLPAFLSPVLGVLATAVLYTLLYNYTKNTEGCMVAVYGMFFTLLLYSFSTIVVNVLWIWSFIPPRSVPREMIFFNDPFIPSLYLAPSAFVSFFIIYLRSNRLQICRRCKLANGIFQERGRVGLILEHESRLQISNLTLIFGILSAVILGYYFYIYKNIEVNARDWYIFIWLSVISIILDELYFAFRYYNLYLDLRENDEIITDSELQDMTAKTYLRFYVVCGNSVYVDSHVVDPESPYRELIDTPFFTKRSVNGISVVEVRTIIRKLTGVDSGELRFFFGRKSRDLNKHSILRYFYFLNGNISDYLELNVDGEWMDFERLKQIYARTPGKLSRLALTDISRLATIILTEKLFNENGFRKNKLKSYSPSFTLEDVRNSDIDFQDDKWIKISLFNSDTRLYRLKRWWRNISGTNKSSQFN